MFVLVVFVLFIFLNLRLLTTPLVSPNFSCNEFKLPMTLLFPHMHGEGLHKTTQFNRTMNCKREIVEPNGELYQTNIKYPRLFWNWIDQYHRSKHHTLSIIYQTNLTEIRLLCRSYNRRSWYLHYMAIHTWNTIKPFLTQNKTKDYDYILNTSCWSWQLSLKRQKAKYQYISKVLIERNVTQKNRHKV